MSSPLPREEAQRPRVGEVLVWSVDLDRGGFDDDATLSADERRRAERLVSRGDAARWAVSRSALRRVLARYAPAAEPSELRIRPDRGGKPRLCDEPGLCFNLSHSGDVALVAVTRGREVGIDVECVSTERDVVRLADRFLPVADASAVRAAGTRRVGVFYERWVRREAVAKCLGVGLAAPLPTASIHVQSIEAGPGRRAALALSGAARPRSVRLLDASAAVGAE
jgi:4'-phosphopantetheinyl transferase